MDFGTEVVFEGMVGETRMQVKARAAVCGTNFLPGDMYPDAVSGMLKYLQAVKEGRNILGPEHLEQVLREEHQGIRIIAKDPHNPRPPICWRPELTIIKV